MSRLFFPTFLFVTLIFAGCGDADDPAQVDQGVGLDAQSVVPDRAVLDLGAALDANIALEPADMGLTQAVDGAQVSAAENCSRWQASSAEGLSDSIHGHLSATYMPITPTPNFGGVPDRYTTARQMMFTRVERFLRDDGVFVVECVYTNDTAFTPPDRDPDNDLMNCEHLWPRARLDGDRSSALYEHQQSDLHHLAPSRPSANSLRGSLHFGVVVRDVNLDALPSKAGLDERGDRVFEPQDKVKGDLARVMFYMSLRWGLDIRSDEERILRDWHRFDPVSEEERSKNDEIETIQGNRNPFIDCPSLVDRIDDFEAFRSIDTNGTLPFP